MLTRRPTSRRPAAFTLIELVLVLVVIAIALGVAAPTLRGWGRGARMTDTADQLVSLARLARTQAVSTAQVHRVTFDVNSRRAVVTAQDGQDFKPIGLDGSAFTVPEGVSVRITDLQNAPQDFVEFYPNGRTQTGRFQLSMDDGYQTLVECGAATEVFRVVPNGGRR